MNKRKKLQRPQTIQLTNRQKINVWTIKAISYCLGLFGLLSCIEFDNMDNNLQGIELFIIFALIGIAISAITWWTLTTRFKYAFIGKEGSFIIACLAIGLIFGTPSLANYYNRTNPYDITCKEYKIQKMEHYHGTRGFHHIYVNIAQNSERLKVTHETYHKLDGQNKVELCLANGGLYFKYIARINTPK